MTCCPTCGQEAPPRKLLVCLNTNTAAFGGIVAQLTLREAEIAEVLRKSHPRTVSVELIAQGIYGAADGSVSTVRVLLCNLRRKLSPLGVTIQNFHRTGYRLEFGKVAA